jgi:hypothetical protein
MTGLRILVVCRRIDMVYAVPIGTACPAICARIEP